MIDAYDIIQEYDYDVKRDDDLSRWNGMINQSDFRHWKRALRSGCPDEVSAMVDQHHLSPELSCTYHNKYNRTRWRRAEDLINKYTDMKDLVVDIGAGSHASVVINMLNKYPRKKYIVCDLVSPLLLAYHNISKAGHNVKYIRQCDVECVADMYSLLRDHDCLMLPHHLCDMLYYVPAGTTFYNSYSLSEMSPDEVEQYMDIIGSTRGLLISENYWSRNNMKCHLCNEDVMPVHHLLPFGYSCRYTRQPHVPTNNGARLVVYGCNVP